MLHHLTVCQTQNPHIRLHIQCSSGAVSRLHSTEALQHSLLSSDTLEYCNWFKTKYLMMDLYNIQYNFLTEWPLINKFPNSMEHSPSWEANRSHSVMFYQYSLTALLSPVLHYSSQWHSIHSHSSTVHCAHTFLMTRTQYILSLIIYNQWSTTTNEM
jgi:hypothetical protein